MRRPRPACSGCYYGQTTNPDAEGDAFVNGSLSGELTIGTANNIIIDGNISYADCSGRWTTGQSGAQDFCPYNAGGHQRLARADRQRVRRSQPPGDLAGNGERSLPSCAGTPGALCDPSDGTSRNLASTRPCWPSPSPSWSTTTASQQPDNGTEGPLDLYGSDPAISHVARSAPSVAIQPVTSSTTPGTRCSNYVSPPSYLVPSTASWDLTSINANAGEHPPRSAPAISGPLRRHRRHRPPRSPSTARLAPVGCPAIRATPLPSPPTNVDCHRQCSGAPPPSIGPIPSTTVSPIQLLHRECQPRVLRRAPGYRQRRHAPLRPPSRD